MSRILKPTALADALTDAGLYQTVRFHRNAKGGYDEHGLEQYMTSFPPERPSEGEMPAVRTNIMNVLDLTDFVRQGLQPHPERSLRYVDLLHPIRESEDPHVQLFYASLRKGTHYATDSHGKCIEYTPRRWHLDGKLAVPKSIVLLVVDNNLLAVADAPLPVYGKSNCAVWSLGYNVFSDHANHLVSLVDTRQHLENPEKHGQLTLYIPLATQPMDVPHRRDPVGPYFIQLTFQLDPSNLFS